MAESKPVKTTIFRYSIGRKTYTLSSTSSSTVLNALLNDKNFKKTYTAKAGMDVIILRKKAPCPAISVNFPCCLLEDNELLEIRFLKRDGNSHGPNTEECDLHLKNPGELIVFLVNTTGRKGIQNVVMENKSLKNKVDCVCVVAVNGETVKKALRRDGRFAKCIFSMDSALQDDEKNITDMKNPVTELKDHKLYSIFRNSSEPMPDSQEMQNSQDSLDDQPQPNFTADTADSSQLESGIPNPQSSGKASSASDKKEMTTTTKSDHTKYENIPNTKETLKILRAQFDSLVKQLKAQKNVKTPAQVQQLLREEFSKETQCFSEIKSVKALMDLSASVCQVRNNNQPIGTGFLLFGTCILTNAHVITDAQGQLLDKLSVSFDFEDLSTASKQEFAIKKKPLAYEYTYTQQHTMDYAVLELKTSAEASELDSSFEASELNSSAEASELNSSAEASELDSSAEASELDSSAEASELDTSEALPPSLLKHYSEPPLRGGVCIIGHPAEGVKKMDMSLIIERLKQEDAVNKHISDHPECFQVIGEAYFKMRQKLDGKQFEYHSCFFHGSSGSPVFDESGKVIGMHSGGYVYNKDKRRPGDKSFGSVIEFAHPLQPILVSILRQTKDKRSDVWESFRAERNTKLVVKLADDMTFRPESTNSCAWEHLTSDEEDMDVDSTVGITSQVALMRL